MKRFLTRTLTLIVLPLASLFGVCEYLLRQVDNDYRYKATWMDRNSETVEVYCLGSSHTYFGFEPSCLSLRAFNAAHVAQGLKYDVFLLNKYIGRMPSLRYVILPMSYFSLTNYDLEQDTENWRVKKYTLYYDCPYHRFTPKYVFESYAFDPVRTIKAALGREDERYCNELGRGSHYLLEQRAADWKASGPEAALRHRRERDSQDLIDYNIKYVEEIRRLCHSHGVTLVLITLPAYATYRDNLDARQLSVVTGYCAASDSSHDDVIYLNWLNHPSFGDADFFDADHLNQYGAERLSHMLDSVLTSSVR
ncbi:MAG: hypothetical protein KBT20_10920 [Bacteroidales bacterium]|nr:hypothetical protein [Candidatus Liminaster caballi]